MSGLWDSLRAGESGGRLTMTERFGTKKVWADGKRHKFNYRSGNLVTVDDTDHIHFCCRSHKRNMEIVSVELEEIFAQGRCVPILYFFLKCPDCENGTVVKTYLKDDYEHPAALADALREEGDSS